MKSTTRLPEFFPMVFDRWESWARYDKSLDEYAASGLLDIEMQLPEEAVAVQKQCWVCGGGEKLGLFFPAGRRNNYRTITTCKYCYRYLTNEQFAWEHGWRMNCQPLRMRALFLLVGFRSILQLKSWKTKTNYSNVIGMLDREIKRKTSLEEKGDG